MLQLCEVHQGYRKVAAQLWVPSTFHVGYTATRAKKTYRKTSHAFQVCTTLRVRFSAKKRYKPALTCVFTPENAAKSSNSTAHFYTTKKTNNSIILHRNCAQNTLGVPTTTYKVRGKAAATECVFEFFNTSSWHGDLFHTRLPAV